MFLTIPRQKTKVPVNVKLLPVFSNQKCNEYLKEIASLCGIKKEVTFHPDINTLALQELAIVKAIADNDTITLDQLSVVSGKSRSTVKRIVDTLKDKGILKA